MFTDTLSTIITHIILTHVKVIKHITTYVKSVVYSYVYNFSNCLQLIFKDQLLWAISTRSTVLGG